MAGMALSFSRMKSNVTSNDGPSWASASPGRAAMAAAITAARVAWRGMALERIRFETAMKLGGVNKGLGDSGGRAEADARLLLKLVMHETERHIGRHGQNGSAGGG